MGAIDKADVRPSPEVAKIRARARALAAELGHVEPMFEHWLLAVVDDERRGAVLAAAGADLDALRAKLVRMLPPGLVFEKPKMRFLSALRTGFAAAGKSEITLGDLLMFMLRHERAPAVQCLRAQGVALIDVLNFLAHGIRKPPPRSRVRDLVGLPRAWLVRAPAPVTAARWDVVAHNDDYTTREHVETMLVRFFETADDDARALTERIQAEGRAVIGTYAHRQATKRVDAATRAAHADSFPLRLSLEPAD